MSSLFKRKQQQPAQANSLPSEPSLIDIDDNAQGGSESVSPARKAGFMNWSGNKKVESVTSTGSPRSQSPKASGLVSPMNPTTISPRISTSSRTSIFERSVDPVSSEGSGNVLVDPSHAQIVVDNQIPSVLDASVEAITSNEDLDKVEVVIAEPSNPPLPPTLPNPWSEEENLGTTQLSFDTQGAAAKRLSFVSYNDLLGVEQAEEEAMSLHSQKSTSPRPQSPESSSRATTTMPSGLVRPIAVGSAAVVGLPGSVPSRPTSTPTSIGSEQVYGGQAGTLRPGRQKSIIHTFAGASAPDLELTRTTMADTIMAPPHVFENENPWA